MKSFLSIFSFLAGMALVSPASATEAGTGISWHKGSVDSAFAQARAQNKPVFLYWGAKWCPPCNQVKATLFNRQDFIDRSRFFVPVYLDGDSPGAQKLGERFNVRGYPTMILFNSRGNEITRLPGEVDPGQYMQVLLMGLNAERPVKVLLAAALGDPSSATLSADDWRLLAYYSWDTDQQQLLATESLSATLNQLAQLCPAQLPEISARLALKSLAIEASAKETATEPAASSFDLVLNVLSDARMSRELSDMLINYSGQVTGYITRPDSVERKKISREWDAALERLVDDRSLSTADRLGAVSARIALARLGSPQLPLAEPLLSSVRAQVQRANLETRNVYERQSVISAAADLLNDAELLDESDQLLRDELKRSHSPYYFMLGLAANAKKRGDKAAAINWSAKAYAAAKGPATRLQWGVSLLRTLVDLAPENEARIEAVARKILGELHLSSDAFYERNRVSLNRMANKLKDWNKTNQHAAVLKRTHRRMDALCRQLPLLDPARTSCMNIFS